MLSLVCTLKNNKYIVNVNNFRVFTEKNGTAGSSEAHKMWSRWAGLPHIRVS